MAVVLDVIKQALKDLGVLAAGEVPTSEESEDARVALNNLLDEWATERLQIYTTTRTTWTIVASTATYTVGSGGTVPIARPTFIDSIGYIDTTPTPDLELPLHMLTDAEYRALPQKPLTSTLPVSWYYEPTYPLGTLSLFPVPTSTTLLGAIYAPTAVTSFAALTTSVALPPGYARMLAKNLAVELAPSYERMINPGLLNAAMESKASVKRSNERVKLLCFPADALIGGSAGRYDINSDEYV